MVTNERPNVGDASHTSAATADRVNSDPQIFCIDKLNGTEATCGETHAGGEAAGGKAHT